MENRQQQILSEIQSMMTSIRQQLEKLDAKMAELQQSVDPEGSTAIPIDIDIEMDDMGAWAPEPVAEPEPEQVQVPLLEPIPEPEPMPLSAPVEAYADDDDDLPLFSEPETLFEVAQKSPKAHKAVIDVMEDKQTWRTDMPGAPVKDILSAISLNDRVQFIHVLFKEDPAAFQNARTKINSMQTLDEVVEYVTSEFDWDMNSQVVYRFMMAVRRKVK